MRRDPVDIALIRLFNIAAKSPLSVKAIFFGDKKLIDSRSIRPTEDYDNSRIPCEHITLARNTLALCHSKLDVQMESLLFLYYHGTIDGYLPQLREGLSILANIDPYLAQAVIVGYRDGATPVADLAMKLNIEYVKANNLCIKARKIINGWHSGIRFLIKDLLIDAGYLEDFAESA